MPPELSKAEYNVLHQLWRQSPMSVRELHDALDNQWAYTTTKTVMDRMVAKELLAREQVHGVNVYRPLIRRSQGVMQWIKFLADKVLELDRSEVLNMFAKKDLYTKEEMAEMRKLLEQDKDGD